MVPSTYRFPSHGRHFQDLTEKRKGTSLLTFARRLICIIPQEAHAAATAHYKDYSKKLYCVLMHLLSNGKFLRKNARTPVASGDGKDLFYIVNGISVAQGPNYALAKRLQHWRAILARSKAGCIVSSTLRHPRQQRRWSRIEPLRGPTRACPGNPKTKLSNPNELFKYGGFHGGTWRCAYEVDSIGESSVFIYFGRLAMPYIGVVAAAGAAIAAKAMGYI
ncbi:3-hydroxy-lignoceroyl-CoA dehydratase [Fragilaria crotonensis]|nr:3-hydroxy-lignoceroyl-CoA dehydratase [Fragilaria crotonensis]